MSTNDESYRLGFFLGQEGQAALDKVFATQDFLFYNLMTVSNAVVITEGLPADWQSQRLREFFPKIAPGGVDKLLLSIAIDLYRSVEELRVFTKKGDVSPYVNEAEMARLRKIAAQLAEAIYNLMDAHSPNHDNGDSLRLVIQEYGQEKALRMFSAMREKSVKFGADKSPVIDRLCERAKPLIDAGKTSEEALDQMIVDTEHDPNAQDEYLKLADWSIAAFNKAYRARYS